MLHIVRTSIFLSKLDAIVCPVNCIPGVMGAGLALNFAERWPWMRVEHRKACRNGMKPGTVWLVDHEQSVLESRSHHVILFPTKQHWKNPSELRWIEAGLDDLHHKYPDMSFASPALGCGLGGLPFEDVADVFRTFAQRHHAEIELTRP